MTDNPLVEAVRAALTAHLMEHVDKETATAALRAIEDAGWKVVKA